MPGGRAARGQGSQRLVVPGVISQGAWLRLRYAFLPQTPTVRPKHGSPGRGRSGRLPTLSGSGRGQGAVRGRGAGRGNRGSPRESPAQPEAGRLQKATCSFLGCLRLLKHTYKSHSRDSYTHIWLHKARRRGEREPLPAATAGVKKSAPITPCHRFNTIHLTPSHPN